MKKYVFLLIVFLVAPAEAYDTQGLLPLSPYGVFSTFSAESPSRYSVGFGFMLEKSIDPNYLRTTYQMSYALFDNIELLAAFPYVYGADDNLYGAEDFNIGFKHRLVDETTHLPAIAYLLTLGAGIGKKEFTTEGSFGGGLILTKKLGPFRAHLNLLASNPQANGLQTEYRMNLGSELAISHNTRILGEIVGRKNYTENKIDLLEWRLGLRHATTDTIFTSVGAGFDFKRRAPEYRLFLMISVILPAKEAAGVKSPH